MDGYLQKPKEMTDEVLAGWVRSFLDQPPTLDLMMERLWAGQVMEEARVRGIQATAKHVRQSVKG